MRLFVGLGNPGAKYAHNRHNIGFMAVDEIARRHDFISWRTAFNGVASKGTLEGEDVILLKPTTYMNESGRSVREVAKFYKLDVGDVVVFHDEIELPAGKLRVKIGGSDAGHNGLRSISAYLNSEYRRVRIGVGRPSIKALVESYVLHDFAKSEQLWLDTIIDAIAENAGLLVEDRDSSFQNKVDLALKAKGINVNGISGHRRS